MSVLNTAVKDNILTATIQRPNAKNAVNFEMMSQLESLLDRLEEEDAIRSFILTGTGDDVFISGGDIKEFHGIKSADEAEDMARRMGGILKRIEMLPCWTIAAVNGATYGGGWETMLAFDFRLASDSATFDFTQGKLYLPPGWGGLTRLVERVGRSTALRWLAETAMIDADTALKHGLIDQIIAHNELHQQAHQWSERMNRNDRDFIKALKKGALNVVQARWKSIEQELEPFAHFWEDRRHHQRVEEFLGKRE